MSLYLGIDTSNYTTSVAAYDSETKNVIHRKKLLPVKSGEKGIRQSDAVFHHTQQLRELFPKLISELKAEGYNGVKDICAVGASVRPRFLEDSYMPCFTVGHTFATAVSEALDVPLHEFSHQEGHIAASLYSANRLDLMGEELLAFHVSGGTTEALRVKPSERCPVSCELLSTSLDLKAGQAVDRVGLMLGLDFPCGPQLERLALESTREFQLKIPKLSDTYDCSLSGVENKCKKMIEDKEPPCDTALFCLLFIEKTLEKMAQGVTADNPGLPLVFSGGVMSNSIIRRSLQSGFDCYFATPEFSADNAAGIAVLTAGGSK